MIDLDAVNATLIRTVDALTPEELRAPSLLPGWSRAHVVAHLALNAEGVAGALNGLVHGRQVPVYPSDAERDAGIEELAGAEPSELRDRLLAGVTRFRDAVAALPPEAWHDRIPRLPGGPYWPVDTVLVTRVREIEIHHADLGLAYSPRDWPEEFVTALIDRTTADHAASPDSPDFAVRATDLDRTWEAGAPSPVVTGTAADLGWWLIGRATGERLRCATGPVPALGPWRRAPTP